MRFVRKLKNKKIVFETVSTAKELQLAFLKIIEIVQNHEFPEEIHKLKRNVALSSNIQKLNPFMHEFKEDYCSFYLLRVG